MSYQYNFGKKILLFNGMLLPSIKYDVDEIGICIKCSNSLKLLSAHMNPADSENDKGHNNTDHKFLVSACIKCSSVFVNIYDSSWSWLADAEPELINTEMLPDSPSDKKEKVFKIPIYTEIINSPEELEKIPMEQLKTIFSAAEIQSIFHKANGEKTVRQYYHRAKKKYPKYEEIYGVRIDI